MRLKILLLPALVLFVLSSYLGCLTLLFVDSFSKEILATSALSFLATGIVLVSGWFLLVFPSFYSRFRQRGNMQDFGFEQPPPGLADPNKRKTWLNRGLEVTYKGILYLVKRFSFTSIVSAYLISLGLFSLAWVGQLTWHDITVWNKDIPLIFFGSRTGENISLGIGLKVIHYFLLSLGLLFLGSFVFLYGRLRGVVNTLKNRIQKLERRSAELEKRLGHVLSDDQVTELLQWLESLEKKVDKHKSTCTLTESTQTKKLPRKACTF